MMAATRADLRATLQNILGDTDGQTYPDTTVLDGFLNASYQTIQSRYRGPFVVTAVDSMDTDADTPDALPSTFNTQLIVLGAEIEARRSRRTSSGNFEILALLEKRFDDEVASEISGTTGA